MQLCCDPDIVIRGLVLPEDRHHLMCLSCGAAHCHSPSFHLSANLAHDAAVLILYASTKSGWHPDCYRQLKDQRQFICNPSQIKCLALPPLVGTHQVAQIQA
jgi:hypothetical protein